MSLNRSELLLVVMSKLFQPFPCLLSMNLKRLSINMLSRGDCLVEGYYLSIHFS